MLNASQWCPEAVIFPKLSRGSHFSAIGTPVNMEWDWELLFVHKDTSLGLLTLGGAAFLVSLFLKLLLEGAHREGPICPFNRLDEHLRRVLVFKDPIHFHGNRELDVFLSVF